MQKYIKDLENKNKKLSFELMNINGVLVRLDHDKKVCLLEKDVMHDIEEECNHHLWQPKDILDETPAKIEEYSERSLEEEIIHSDIKQIS